MTDSRIEDLKVKEIKNSLIKEDNTVHSYTLHRELDYWSHQPFTFELRWKLMMSQTKAACNTWFSKHNQISPFLYYLNSSHTSPIHQASSYTYDLLISSSLTSVFLSYIPSKLFIWGLKLYILEEVECIWDWC